MSLMPKADGSLTGDFKAMDTELREFWEPIFQLCKHNGGYTPDWDTFIARYGRYLPQRSPMAYLALTPESLRATLRRMDANTSAGADAWTVPELRKMPTEWLQRLCDLLHLVEEVGCWPESIAQGLIAPVPKEPGSQAKNTRPITVMSCVYRLWAGTRVGELISWQERWSTNHISSYKPAQGCEDSWWAQALKVEWALLHDEPLAGANIDFAKAFDRLPNDLLLQMAEQVGTGRPLAVRWAQCTDN